MKEVKFMTFRLFWALICCALRVHLMRMKGSTGRKKRKGKRAIWTVSYCRSWTARGQQGARHERSGKEAAAEEDLKKTDKHETQKSLLSFTIPYSAPPRG